ncbi:MAG: MaoC family dehydratase [Bacteroidales bacterium]|nr:MaoC family dehydratase [Bacteroidales bacterium]
MKITDFYVGQSYEMRKAFSSEEVARFAALTLDDNPLHLDEAFASKSVFGQKIVHGYLSSSLFSAIIGTKMPGQGAVYLKQDLNFRKPVFHDEEIRAVVSVEEINVEKSVLRLSTVCYNAKNEVVIDGMAVVKIL